MCNYNMANTLAEACRSILDQVDDRFELLVIDDASSDQSPDVLKQLSQQYANMRYRILSPDPDRHLGETRNISIQEAEGEYVLPQLDADDRYDRIEGGIIEFVKLFHEIEQSLDFDFYLSGGNINIGQRRFLLDIGPYRNLPVGAEDLDLWRRLLISDKLVCIDHKKIHTPDIGYKKSSVDRLRRSYQVKFGNLRTGISFREQLSWDLADSPIFKIGYYLPMVVAAYLHAWTTQQYPLPKERDDLASLHVQIERKQAQNIVDIENRYNISIRRDIFTAKGKQMFGIDWYSGECSDS